VGQQHLRGLDAVGGEAGFVDLGQAHLAAGGAGLQFVDVGRAAAKPRRSMPSAIAPEDTSTTSLPRVRSEAIWAAQRAMAALSRPRPSLVTSEEPTLTMMRLDWCG
jgi:hypothetical protein